MLVVRDRIETAKTHGRISRGETLPCARRRVATVVGISSIDDVFKTARSIMFLVA